MITTLLLLCTMQCPDHAAHMAQQNAQAQGQTNGQTNGQTDGQTDSQTDGHHGHAATVDGNHDSFGMSHDATTHHFRILDDGGAIELTANDANDAKSIEAIRAHLRTVAADFAKNDFAKPQFVHGTMPDGAETMKAKVQFIAYRYEELPQGGRVRMTTKDADALDAIHRFMKFQIGEHRTGD
jgi:hypothetical protein